LLCPKCNIKVTSNRGLWMKHFQSRIRILRINKEA
jgi:hypothetical protein